MTTVITVPRDSSLLFRLLIGANPETGAPIITSKSFAKIKSTARCPFLHLSLSIMKA